MQSKFNIVNKIMILIRKIIQERKIRKRLNNRSILGNKPNLPR